MSKAKRIRVVMRRIGRLPPPANETPQERFIRLASGPTGRVTRLLRDLRLLGNLAGPSYAPGQELWRVEIAVNDELRDSAFFPEPWEAMREFFDSYMNEKLSEPVSS